MIILVIMDYFGHLCDFESILGSSIESFRFFSLSQEYFSYFGDFKGIFVSLVASRILVILLVLGSTLVILDIPIVFWLFTFYSFKDILEVSKCILDIERF